MKVVLDTNVLLAAFATRGLCAAVYAHCLAKHDLVLSEPILKELTAHLTGKFKMPAPQVRQIAAFLRRHALLVDPAPVATDACRDPDDLMVLGTLLAGNADCLVTGDADLQILGRFQNIPILSPRAFYERQR